MTLSAYLEKHGLSPAEFARRCEPPLPPSTVTRLLANERDPGIGLLTRIYNATAGEVTPNDFMSLPAAQP